MCLRNPYIYLMTGIILFGVGTVFLFKTWETWGFFLITLAFAFFTISQGVRAHEQVKGGQAQIQEQIERSERQIILNQNEIFERLIDRFGDLRINLFWNIKRGDFTLFEYTIWRSETIVARAWKLVKYSEICKENQKRLFGAMRFLVYHSLIPWKGIKKGKKFIFKPAEKDIKNMLKMCNNFKEFEIDEEDRKELKGMIKYFKDLMKTLYGKDRNKDSE